MQQQMRTEAVGSRRAEKGAAQIMAGELLTERLGDLLVMLFESEKVFG